MPQLDDRDTRPRSSKRELLSDIRNVATYQAPMLATLQGRPVRIIATGDAPGHSPVCQYIDDEGSINWDEQERFTVIDTAFLPVSLDTLRQVNRSSSR